MEHKTHKNTNQKDILAASAAIEGRTNALTCYDFYYSKRERERESFSIQIRLTGIIFLFFSWAWRHVKQSSGHFYSDDYSKCITTYISIEIMLITSYLSINGCKVFRL